MIELNERVGAEQKVVPTPPTPGITVKVKEDHGKKPDKKKKKNEGADSCSSADGEK